MRHGDSRYQLAYHELSHSGARRFGGSMNVDRHSTSLLLKTSESRARLGPSVGTWGVSSSMSTSHVGI